MSFNKFENGIEKIEKRPTIKKNYGEQITMVVKKGLLKQLYWATAKDGDLLNAKKLPCKAENLVVLTEKKVMMNYAGYKYRMDISVDKIMSKLPEDIADKTVALEIKKTFKPKENRTFFNSEDSYAIKVTAYGLAEGAHKPPIAEYANIANENVVAKEGEENIYRN